MKKALHRRLKKGISIVAACAIMATNFSPWLATAYAGEMPEEALYEGADEFYEAAPAVTETPEETQALSAASAEASYEVSAEPTETPDAAEPTEALATAEATEAPDENGIAEGVEVPDDVADEDAFDEEVETPDGQILENAPSVIFEQSTDEVRVTVVAGVGVFPEGTTMEVVPAEDEETISKVSETVEDEKTKVTGVKAVEVTFYNAEHEEIEPSGPVFVTLEDLTKIKEEGAQEAKEEETDEAQITEEAKAVHVTDEGECALMASASGEDIQNLPMEWEEDQAKESVKKIEELSEEATVAFIAETFSTYALVYTVDFTVDFHYDVNGKTFDFSIPGGGFVSLEHLVEVLGIADDPTDSENVSDDTAVSEKTREFVSNIEKVEFSHPDLVWVGKAETDTTVGELKEANGLECQNSADLTQEQIEEINRSTVEEGDWALIAVQPFTSEEALTVYMTNGDQFMIRVTDDQITELIMSASGEKYKVTVTYDSNAGIPDGSKLAVEEILQEPEVVAPDETESTDADTLFTYDEYIRKTAEALGWEEGSPSYIRLFDIKIVDPDGRKVEIAAPVDVRIELADKESSRDTKVVHFADGAENGDVIENVETEGAEVHFAAEGFSAYAIVDGPGAVPTGWQTVKSVSELISMGSQGVYVGHPDGYYYMNTTTGDSTRTGITKTKPAQAYPPTDKAAKYYFEQVPGTTDQVYAYCYAPDGTTKQYVFNGGNNSLSFAADESGKTAFKVTQNSNGTFKLNNGAWYWNMQGGANGSRFCSWSTANDVNNNVDFWYYTDVISDPYNLDNKSYGLMFWDESLYGKAMMSSSETANALDAKALMVLATADNKKQLFVPNDSDISMWTFHWNDNDHYYLTATVDGSTKYLKIDAGGLSLVDNESEASLIQVVPGSGTHAGQICLRSGDTTLTYSGTTASGFSTGGSVGSEWLNLVELSELTSDYYKTYSASKVSVSDESITTGSKVIIYTRAWNEETLEYEYYAIDHDGTLVRVYESGDSIEWVGNVINTMLWQFTDYPDESGNPTYFYELYNEYAQKYLAPQVTGGQVVADDTIGINMNGRRNGQYYSTILAWDDANYSYAGLKVENGQIVSCPKAEAMDFYFAVMQDIPVDDALTTVKTVDHTQYGITMKVVDFNTKVVTYDSTPTTQEQHNVMGTSEFTQWNAQPGLLSTSFGENGYPTAVKTNKSLGQLFQDARKVNHLFIESIYNATGYYEFDSSQNFASLNGAPGGNYNSGFDGNFTVYKELGTYDSSNKNTLKHGQFLPFNNIEAGRFASVNRQNLYSTVGDSLPDSDPRKYENLYLVKDPTAADLYFGVELEASFTQTPNGLDDWGHDIIFEFTGDDDFWLYVDGELVIDLGGVHSALPGSVNFRTGDVYVNGAHTTLLDLFRSNYMKREGITDPNDPGVIDHLKEYFEYDESTGEFSPIFKDYSTHKMNIFYMERGGGASNLHMRFNLASVKPGTVELSKELAGVDESESPLAEFAYQIKYKWKGDVTEHLLTNHYQGASDTNNYVFYKNTANPVTFESSRTIGGVAYPDVFILKPGETVVINFPASELVNKELESYSIVECGVNTEVFSSVAVNGTVLDGSAVSGSVDRKDYDIGYKSTGDRPRVNYVNAVNREAMRTLTFRKKLYDADGSTSISHAQDGTVFDFRLYLGTESDTELSGANMHTYHVRDESGNYCSWDAANQMFKKIGGGIKDYTQLSPEQKVAASFSTSMNGSISRIPVDYSVEVREILAGTKYRVQERPAEIPDGYSFQKYVYYDDYDPADGTSPDATATYSGDNANAVAMAGAPDSNDHDGTVYNEIATGKDPHVDVCNLKGYGLRVKKVWTDADYMAGRNTAYFAVYTKKKNHGSEHGSGQGSLEMVPGSLRALPYGTSTLYWYWLTLPVPGVAFDDYVIREVEIRNGTPVVDEDGIVTNADTLNLKWIEEGETLTLRGTQKGETTEDDFTYTVHYIQGTVSSESNVRVDTVTNDRPGIILKKQDWDGHPLAGAVFSFAEEGSDTLIGTFTSDSDGYITTAFLSENKNYTLTETAAPQGYHGLETAMTIKVTGSHSGQETGVNGSTVSVSGPDSAYYSLSQASGTTPATLIIKNRPYVLRAVKQDGDTQLLLAGVHFELHKQVTVDGVTVFDNAVMTGYEDLVTGSDGVIPLIDNTLPAGTYQIREKTAPSGYQTLPGYIEFTVSRTGAVSLLPSMSSAQWVSLTETTDPRIPAELVYTMTIRNYINASVTIRKVDDKGNNLLGAKFRLYKYGTSWETVDGYSEIDLTSVNRITLNKLSVGRYSLEEIHAPDGYVILTKHIYFNIAQDGKASLTDESGTGGNSNAYASISAAGNTITVKNITGAALPSTGGTGTRLFTILGSILILEAGVLLLKRRKLI